MIRLLIAATDAQMRGGEIPVCPTHLRNVIIEVGQAALPSVDAVVFAEAPAEMGAIEAALRAGKHVLYAADPCVATADWAALQALALQQSVRLTLVNPDRWRPSRRLVKQLIPDKLGQAALVRMHRWDSSGRPAIFPAGLPGPLWRDIDTALWLAGRTPNVVFALQHGLVVGAGACLLHVHFGYADGGMALIDYDNRLPAGDPYHALSVIGTTGAAYADDQENMQLLYRGGRSQALRAEEDRQVYRDLIQSFADSLRAKQDLSEQAVPWQQVVAVAEAIGESLATGKAVHL
jgi:predicted dehydrogenase